MFIPQIYFHRPQVWGWMIAARRQHPLDLHWRPVHPGQDPMYGGGVQFGKCFRQTCRTCPQGSYPMTISLHWDDTNEHKGLAVTPICVGVANGNNMDISTQFCLTYMSSAPDNTSPEFRKTPLSTAVKFAIRQQCIAAIMTVLEAAAARGVTCRLRN